MSAQGRAVLFDLFGVIALPQVPGALAAMATQSGAGAEEFEAAYWDRRPEYDAGRITAVEYWTRVLGDAGMAVTPELAESLRLDDIASWSRVDPRMVEFVRDLNRRTRVGLLSNIPADHADAFLRAQPWLHELPLLALSGRMGCAKPDPAAFHHCVAGFPADPHDILFVDDRAENVDAARAVGLRGHVFSGMEGAAAAIEQWVGFSVHPL